ncbi:hypothetical protein [Microbacterium sp. JC 701]|nr:hypothetical protein [Microbacterium sp. JC 701]
MTSHMSVGDSTRRFTDAESHDCTLAMGPCIPGALTARREVAL